MNNYKVTIGIEVHVELKTKSKLFSYGSNDYNKPVNTAVTVVDLGYPGVLPRVNEKVINLGIKTSSALGCKINKLMHFDRKNYYYPDLPKGYQITQARTPIGYDGKLKVNEDLEVGIFDVHIEEDTCKSLHTDSATLLNYNRAGVPLLEIVSTPSMHSESDAMEYLEALRTLLLYLDVSDCKMEEGSMRADVNVSVSLDDSLGVRTETKNIGSIKDVGLAITAEVKRQIDALENGFSITEETRKYDKDKNQTILMRKKEVGNDYRYFPEPDIPFITLSDELIEKVVKEIGMLPSERRSLYVDRGILEINAFKIINNRMLSDYLNMFIDTDINFKIASNLLLSDIASYLNKEDVSIFETKLTKKKFIELVNLLDEGKITSNIFKSIIVDVMEKSLSIEEIISDKNISLSDDLGELDEIIKDVLKKEEKSVLEYKNGKSNASKYLMGLVMKEARGKFNPKVVMDHLLGLLSKDVN